jgi:hypothetical protein
MVQVASWAGPLNFGIHISFRALKYIDLHLPYMVVTIGCINSVEYPPWYWSSSRDIASGAQYGRDK